jgi:hypothetical protein
MLSELIRYVAYKESLHAQTVELDELYAEIKPFMKKMFEYINKSSDEEFKSKFTVIFGSSGYHEYFFKLFALIEEDVPDLKPDGYEEFKRATSAETTELADRQVKWIQAVVPTYFKDQLREKFGENFFEVVVPKEVQKSCQIKRVDDESEDKLPVEEYLDWIQYATLAGIKEIRDEVKDVLSIRLPDEPSGKHFYRGWFDAINRIRRVPAHPSGRAYKDKDIEVLAIVIDHLKSNLPEHYVDGMADASLS